MSESKKQKCELELEEILSSAISAAKEAGAHMKEKLGRVSFQTKSSSQDLVTAVDEKCQNLIETRIKQQHPTHQMLGEEDVEPGSEASKQALEDIIAKSDWLWVVDPIDGTTNFVHSRPASVVSIAVAYKGIVQVGVIYDPYRDELFSAERNKGSFCNGQKITVSAEKSMGEALIGFGIGTKDSVRLPMLKCCELFSSKCRGVRLQGSAAIELAWLACGRQTGFYELDLNSWDLAAGSLLVTEAGGRISESNGDHYSLRTRHLVASNGCDEIHDELIQCIKKANAVVPNIPK